MFFVLLWISFAVLSVWVFVNIQRYMEDPLKKQKSEEWFKQFLEHNKETYSDPKLAWRYNVIENLFDGIHT